MVRLIWRLLVMRTVLLVRRWLQLGSVFIAGTAGTAMAAGTVGTADTAVAAGAVGTARWYDGGCMQVRSIRLVRRWLQVRSVRLVRRWLQVRSVAATVAASGAVITAGMAVQWVQRTVVLLVLRWMQEVQSVLLVLLVRLLWRWLVMWSALLVRR